MIKVTKICPMCKSQTSLKLTNEDFKKLLYRKNEFIQDLFPHLDIFKREFLISSYCPNCQMLIFAKKYKITSDWDIN